MALAMAQRDTKQAQPAMATLRRLRGRKAYGATEPNAHANTQITWAEVLAAAGDAPCAVPGLRPRGDRGQRGRCDSAITARGDGACARPQARPGSHRRAAAEAASDDGKKRMPAT